VQEELRPELDQEDSSARKNLPQDSARAVTGERNYRGNLTSVQLYLLVRESRQSFIRPAATSLHMRVNMMFRLMDVDMLASRNE